MHADIAIRFSGEHAGNAVSGRFGRWQADIRIDTDDLTRSHIGAMIFAASTTDGVPLHDNKLPHNILQSAPANYAETGHRMLR